ncbi:Stage II sporulation protein E (SpoIIE) [Roseibium album]|nr:Stage II sporulation protein E (SpoIIE) [Roseibium album]
MELDWNVEIRSYQGAPRGGDMGLVIPLEDGALAALVDATGHGLPAYAVAQTVRKTLFDRTNFQPDVLLNDLDVVLEGSIGAAISLARIYSDRIDFAGVGNVNAIIGGNQLLVRTGIVGQRMRTPHLTTAAFPEDTWFVMYTDGVARPRSIPAGNAATASRQLIENAGSDHDDAGVLMARWKRPI